MEHIIEGTMRKIEPNSSCNEDRKRKTVIIMCIRDFSEEENQYDRERRTCCALERIGMPHHIPYVCYNVLPCRLNQPGIYGSRYIGYEQRSNICINGYTYLAEQSRPLDQRSNFALSRQKMAFRSVQHSELLPSFGLRPKCTGAQK